MQRLKDWIGGVLESASLIWESLTNWLRNRRWW